MSSCELSCRVSWRLFHVSMVFCSSILGYMMRNGLSVAIIPLSAEQHIPSQSQGLLLSSFYIGYFFFQAIAGTLAKGYGAKWPIVFALIGSGLITIAFPFVQSSFAGLVLMRVATGMVQAFLYPSVYMLLSVWIPQAELCRAATLFTTGAYIGTVLADFIAPLLSSCCGWPEIFYVFGMLPFIWLTPWTLFAAASPAVHPFISADERQLIEQPVSTGGDNDDTKDDEQRQMLINRTEEEEEEQHVQQPQQSTTSAWAIILRSREVWGLVCTQFAANWLSYLLMGYLPTYFVDAHSMSTTYAGWISALAYLLLTGTSVASAMAIDWLLRIRPTWTRTKIVFGALGLCVPSTLLPFLGLHSIDTTGAIVLAVIATSSQGMQVAALASNQMDIAPRHASLVFGLSNTIATIPGALGVYISGWVLQLTNGSWVALFSLATIVGYVGALSWACFGSVKPIEKLS